MPMSRDSLNVRSTQTYEAILRRIIGIAEIVASIEMVLWIPPRGSAWNDAAERLDSERYSDPSLGC